MAATRPGYPSEVPPPDDQTGAALRAYRSRRRFSETPEPEGAADGPEPGAPGRFVVHEHHARRLHWDLRLEHDGVLLSFAVPRGIPDDPKRNHLAVHTEDHPIEYLDFEGEIPSGEYGAGTMRTFDTGTFELHKLEPDEIVLTMHGRRVRGRYALFRTQGDDWMIHRIDPPEDPERRPPPADLRPMLATAAADPPSGSGWAWELKWDGVRALGFVEGGRLRLVSRNGNDVTGRYPEVRGLGAALGARPAVVDGEVVAFDETGRPDFQRLQQRMHVEGEHRVRRLATRVPVTYVLFDLLWLDGRSLMELPYDERRAALAELPLDGAAWRVPPNDVGDEGVMVSVSREFGLEGVIAKRRDSRYEPGRRSRSWVKVRNLLRQELVVGGWSPGRGARAGRIGSLLVGYHEQAGDTTRLRYAGRVGSGLTDSEIERLGRELRAGRRATNPFDVGTPPRGSVFVEPRLVVEVRFSEWTRAGLIRQPVYLGTRDDKDPRDVVRET